MAIDLNYTPAQELVFFPATPVRFTIVAKGRRAGLTRGAAQAFCETALTVKTPQRFLWGETIFSNVQRYIDLYFRPILDKLPDGVWNWSPRLMQMTIKNTVIDFRSADTPENWEGFGYNLIYLNEAGIILRNPDLYKKTVLPMLMDFPDSKLIAAGVPKGKKIKGGAAHPFFELWEKADGTLPNYVRHKFGTRSNPYLSEIDIAEVEAGLDELTRLQEIDGEFTDSTDNPYLYAFETTKHTGVAIEPDAMLPIWLSFDFNIEPNSCIVGQKPTLQKGRVIEELSINGGTEEVCDRLVVKYAHWINKGLVFVTGDATGKNRNSISGELTNYKIIRKALKLRDYNMKVRTSNMEVKASRILCNSILAKGDVQIAVGCKQTIADCQLANVDGSGDLIKDTGMHKLDCFRYILEAWFPDFLDKPQKYVNVVRQPVPTNPLEKHYHDKQ